MLVVDPLKRITVEEIRKHAWFQVNLPKYLSYPAYVHTHKLQDIDEDILQEIVKKFAVDRETVVEALTSDDSILLSNEFQVSYNLIYDNQKMYTERTPTSTVSTALFATSPPINLREEIPFDFEEEDNMDTNDFSTTKPLIYSESKPRKWSLGVVSSLPPNSIMQELFRALKQTGFEWKMTGPFALRCRNPIGKGKFVKIALQVYKVKEKRYLLDIKKLEDGETFPYFDVCHMFLNELKL